MPNNSLVTAGSADRLKNQNTDLDPKIKLIDRKVTQTIDFGVFDDIGGSFLNIGPDVKTLIFRNAQSLSAIVNHSEFLRNSQVFVVIFYLSGTFVENELAQLNDKIKIPIILQVAACNSNRLFFTNTENELKEVVIDDSQVASISKHFDFDSVCNLLHVEPKFGKFSFELTEMEIDTEACFKGKRLVDLAVEHGDLLALRFLMLFQPDLEAFNDEKERVLEVAIENGNLELLKAVLDDFHESDTSGTCLSPEKRHALNLMTDGDLSLLMLAARSGKTEIAKFLIKCGLNVNHLNDDEQTACDFAWDNGSDDSVIALVRADSPFPYDFDLDELPVDSKLRKMSEEREKLHEHIKSNQINEVNKFVQEYPTIRCAYDKRNQCALVTALESKNFDIYSFLRSKGFTSGIDGDHKKILSSLEDAEKNDIKFSNRKYFPSNENSHIMDLLSRSRLGFRSEQKNFGKIQKYFEDLDAIPEVQPILRVISLAKKLDIVFDFNQSCIADMDPTQSFKHTLVKGRTIYDNGNILIGAKDSDADVLATIAHEFTHYAMQLLYENQGHPYHIAGDEDRQREFSEIVKSCEAMKHKHPVIENVFEYQLQEHAVELIVRVPHLLALHYQELNAITQVRKDFETLFKFFTQRVLLACEQEIPAMKAKEKIRDLNKFLGTKRELEASKMFCENIDEFDNDLRKPENILIRSSVPNLALCNLLNIFKMNGHRNVDSSHIFIKLNQLMDKELSDMIREAFDSVAEPRMFVLATEKLTHFADVKELFNIQILRSRVVLIAKSVLTKQKDEENFKSIFPIQHQSECSWSDLNKISQEKVLSSKFQFQGLELSLSDVVHDDSEILKELPLEEVLKLPEIKLKTFNESVPPSPEIYIKRTFENTSYESTEPLTSVDIIELLVSARSLILADESGMGKSVSALLFARKLKQRHPTSWVVFIDLKKHTEHFYKDDDVSPDDITCHWFSDKILNLDNGVQMKLFEHFFENAKVIFVIDGFDEISPVYSNCILEVVETIHVSNNMLLVATRTYLTKTLEKSLQSRIIKLQGFTIDDQIEILVKFWARSVRRPIHELEKKARSLLENFEENMALEDFFGVPLQVRMLAEIYEKSDPSQAEIQELNVFSLYQSFVKKKTDIWVDKGQLAKDDNTIIQTLSSLNITQIHQKLAIENFFAEDITEALGLPEIEENMTKEFLARIGLLQIEFGKLQFTHESLGEYFVADFVIMHVAKKSLMARSPELHQMFLEVLRDEKFEKVRSFLNGRLEMKEKLNVDVLSVRLEKSFQVQLNRSFFRNLVKENLSALMIFMLTTVQISKNCKVSLIKQGNAYNEMALHTAATFSSLRSFKQLWSCIESFTESYERTELLFATGNRDCNVLQYAIFSNRNDVLQEILEIALRTMDADVFKNFVMHDDKFKNNALLLASEGRPIAFEILWKAVEQKLEARDQKEFLSWKNALHLNVLLTAVQMKGVNGGARYLEVIQSILKITKKVFNDEEMRKFLLAQNVYRCTALHHAVENGEVEVFTILWNFIQDVLPLADQKNLWRMKNPYNILYQSLRLGSSRKTHVAKEVVAISKEILDAEELRKAFTEKTAFFETFISSAVNLGISDHIFDPEDSEWIAEEYAAYRILLLTEILKGHSATSMIQNIEMHPTLRDLRKALKTDVNAGELKALLYAEDETYDTVLAFALHFGSSFLADRIFQLADAKLDRKERLELIRSTSDTGFNILGQSSLGKTMGSVCNFLMRQSDLVSEVKQLFLMPDHKHYDFFSSSAMVNRSCLVDVLEWFKHNFDRDELRKICFEPNFSSQPLVNIVAEKCDEALVKKFLQICSSSFEVLEVKEMIMIRNVYEDNNALGRSLYNKTSGVVSEVWSFYNRILTEAELEELLFKNHQGRVYFIKAKRRNLEAIEALKAIVIDLYGAGKSRKLFR